MACQIINLVLSFVTRTIFIQTLGSDYLGVNGLFSNILSILSFAELGIGNAIVFSMYRPLAENDSSRLAALMSLYKKAYLVIFAIVTIAGLAVIPFLHSIINGEPNISENLSLIYLLFLANTAISYLVVYKKSILTADQKNYIVLSATEVAHILQIVLQIYVLYQYHSFIGFLVIQILCTLAGNMFCSTLANKKYPYINKPSKPLPDQERKNIFNNIKAMAMYKLGSIVLNGTDNIIVSSLLGVTPVGIVSNYVLLHSSCNSILGNITHSFTASVGNLNVVGEREHKYEIFNRILLITVWLYGLATIGLIVISNPFIEVWIGKDYVVDELTVFAIMSGFYVFGVHTVESNYRSAMGFFVKGRWAPFASAVLNVLLSIILCKAIGLAGVFIATPIARFCFIGVVDTYLIYREGFQKSPYIYFAKNIVYLFVMGIIYFLCKYAITFITHPGWLGVLIDIAIVLIIYNTIMLLAFGWTKEFKGITNMIKNVILKKK